MRLSNQNPKTAHLALLLFGAGLLFLPLAYPGWQGTSSDLLPKRTILYLLGLGISAVWFWAARSGPTVWRHTPLTLPAVLYVLFNLLSLSWAINFFSGWIEAIQLLVLLLLFLAFIAFFRPHHILLLIQSNTLSGLLVSLIGIAQYLGIGFETILSVGLPSSTFIFRNLAASYLVGSIPLGFLAFLLDPVPPRKLLWGISTGIMSLFLFYTRTRGAWVGLAGACFLAILLVLTQRPLRESLYSLLRSTFSLPLIRWGMPICLLAFLGGTILPAETSKKIIQQFDEKKTTAFTAAASLLIPGSDRGRFVMWEHTGEMVLDYPLLGVGLDNWEFVFPLYDKGDKITTDSEPVRPHNDFLWIVAELGLIGFCIYLWLLITAARTAWHLFQTGTPEIRATALVSIVGLGGLLGHSLFSFPKEQPASATLFWFHLALLGLLSAREKSPAKSPLLRLVPILGILIAGIALYLNWRHISFDRHFYRARAYESATQWSNAYREISLALDQGTFDHRARFLKARYLQQAGQPQAAETAYLSALKIHPNYAHSHHNLGGLYAVRKAWPKAITSYQKALDIHPGYIQARIHLGNAYVATGQFEKALGEFQTIIRYNPDYADAYSNLGAIYLRQNRLDNAIAAFQSALTRDPEYAEAYNNIGYAYEQKGRYRESIDAYTNLLKYWKGDPAYRQTVLRRIETLRPHLEDQ